MSEGSLGSCGLLVTLENKNLTVEPHETFFHYKLNNELLLKNACLHHFYVL